jgi:hypothetical protein
MLDMPVLQGATSNKECQEPTLNMHEARRKQPCSIANPDTTQAGLIDRRDRLYGYFPPGVAIQKRDSGS